VRTSCLKEIREKINRNIKQMEIDNNNKAAPGRVTQNPNNMNKQSNHNSEKKHNALGSQTAVTSQRKK